MTQNSTKKEKEESPSFKDIIKSVKEKTNAWTKKTKENANNLKEKASEKFSSAKHKASTKFNTAKKNFKTKKDLAKVKLKKTQRRRRRQFNDRYSYKKKWCTLTK